MSAQERMIRLYDSALGSKDYQHYFEDSGFYNFGLWDGGARTQREASEALIDELTGRIKIKGGRILDVACGPGATTRHLMRSYEPRISRRSTYRKRNSKPPAAARPAAHSCAWTRRGSLFPTRISMR